MTRDIEGELDHLDRMITSLVEILEERGIVSQKAWETRIRAKIEKAISLTKFEDLKD